MANKSKNVNDIVSQTARALASGKSFGGWTDKVEEQTVKQGPPIKIKLGKGRKIGSKVADIGPGGEEHNVTTDAEWDAHQRKVNKERIRQGDWEDSFDASGFALAQGLMIMKEEMEVMEVNWGGAASGAATGAMIGSMTGIPLVGTLGGAAIGGLIGGMSGKKKEKAKALEIKRQAQDKSRAIRSGKGGIKSPGSNIAKPGVRPHLRNARGAIGGGIRKIGSKIGGMLKRRAGVA